ncbi:MAG: ADP-ribosylglycohydrolase family protein [Candidatus Acidiferrum sp.]
MQLFRCGVPGARWSPVDGALLGREFDRETRFRTDRQLERYTRWAKHGHLSSNGHVFDVGITVQTALANFAKTHKPYCGPSDPLSAGNGSLMRLAPVPLFYVERPAEAIERSGDSSNVSRKPEGLPTRWEAWRRPNPN